MWNEIPGLRDMVGNGVEKSTMTTEMYLKRRKMQRSDYTHHFQECLSAYAAYVQKYRRLHDSHSLADIPMSDSPTQNECRARYGDRPKLPIAYVRPPSLVAPQSSLYYHPYRKSVPFSAPFTNAKSTCAI